MRFHICGVAMNMHVQRSLITEFCCTLYYRAKLQKWMAKEQSLQISVEIRTVAVPATTSTVDLTQESRF